MSRGAKQTAATALLIALASMSTIPATGADPLRSRDATLEAFSAAHPGVGIHRRADRVRRVYGRSFSGGSSADQSVELFKSRYARMLSAEPRDLVPDTPGGGESWGQPVMYLPEEGRYRFTAFAYRQSRGGIDVFRSRLVLLVRNEPGFPLVLASADLRDLQSLDVDPSVLPAPDAAVIERIGRDLFGAEAEVAQTAGVIWAGVDDLEVEPRLAHRSKVRSGPRRWLLITDAFTGEVLYEEDLLRREDLEGTVEGISTEGAGAEQCEEEVPMLLPYAQVTAGPITKFTDAFGAFSFTVQGSEAIDVMARLSGLWFDVINVAGAEATDSQQIVPGTEVNLLLNSSNVALERAQVNAYVSANEVRDRVLEFNPAYPGLNLHGFSVRVNRTDGLCPGNAWYNVDDPSINFCQAGGGHPNTSWSSVVYHEYGHHLVESGGSGQSAYGEGMGDCVSVVMLDMPELGLGFNGGCEQPLRSADNGCQYQSSGCSTCGSSSHSCGRLLSGCVWDLREELRATDPVGYRDTLAALVFNSILVHTGGGIDPSITIDFLTLDDDNADLLDGSPNYQQIAAAFGAHGMPAPPLSPLGFSFPEGLPPIVDPAGGDTVLVEVFDLGSLAEPATGMLHLSQTGEPGSFVATPMTELAPNVYEATFPEAECGTLAHYYFSAQTTGDVSAVFPYSAPIDSLSVITATSVQTVYTDDFESGQSWTVTNADGLTDGAWEIEAPAGGGDRGDPPVDADGSGVCALTDNADGNSDVDNGLTTLTSRKLNATAGTAFVSYWRWYSNSSGTGAYQDTFSVQVSDDDGQNWTLLETVGPDGPEVEGGWFFRQFRIDEFVQPTSEFRIRFTASDAGTPSIVEAGVDGVAVRSYWCDQAPTCPADLDGDQIVGVDDLLAVIVAWGQADPGADVTGDGIVDVEDLVAVVLDWGPCEQE